MILNSDRNLLHRYLSAKNCDFMKPYTTILTWFPAYTRFDRWIFTSTKGKEILKSIIQARRPMSAGLLCLHPFAIPHIIAAFYVAHGKDSKAVRETVKYLLSCGYVSKLELSEYIFDMIAETGDQFKGDAADCLLWIAEEYKKAKLYNIKMKIDFGFEF